MKPADFEAKWRADGPVKLGPGLYVSKLVDSGLYVLNGFYPTQRERFTAPDAKVIWFVVNWAESDLSWEDFRANVVGATDPSKAPPTSIRGTIMHDWQALGLKAQPNMGENGIHASAGPLEGLHERCVWTGATVQQCSFGTQLLLGGVAAATIESLLANPVVTLNGSSGPVFDFLEDKQTSVAFQLIRQITESNKPKPSTTTNQPPVTTTTNPVIPPTNPTSPAPKPSVSATAPAKPAGTKLASSIHRRPPGPTNPNPGGIPATKLFTADERRALEHNQISLKIENEKYLRSHPAFGLFLTEMMKEILLHEPANPVDFLEEYILSKDLSEVHKVSEQKKKLQY
eukprot:PhF_6_TR10777/c1_g1_i3/m.17303